MPSLTDLLSAAKRSETVSVLGLEMPCRALTLGEIADLLWRFPELRALIMQRQVDPRALLKFAPLAIDAIIAMATGHGGVEAEEKAAGELPPGVQLTILASIIRQSFPGGLVPLVEMVTELATGAPVAALTGAAPATK